MCQLGMEFPRMSPMGSIDRVDIQQELLVRIDTLVGMLDNQYIDYLLSPDCSNPTDMAA